MHARHSILLPIALTLAACGSGPSSANEQADAALPAPATNAAPPLDPAASRIDFATMAGRWKVVGVAVPEGGVQALVKDDPAYMGRLLDISAERLMWVGGKDIAGATLSDQCDGPVTARQTGAAAQDYAQQFAAQTKALHIDRPDPHAVECDDGQWGPEASGGAIILSAPDGRIAMSWYDGAMLLLAKI
ncbi:hypothetical protein [Sphingobium sp. WCS2017Hpa-17]|uniref:hypothetical protein n=1 Tax=Sphingobium sp. WCS2017Hpa-17 TaxID=3073638 RepID=UPI00288BB279|nr:hypothetical protein [Sphingobium sp. WCS2017Hpa-17]